MDKGEDDNQYEHNLQCSANKHWEDEAGQFFNAQVEKEALRYW